MKKNSKRKGRPALKLPPTYGYIQSGLDAYMPHLQLRQVARESGRFWSFHSVPTTVALPDNRFAKSLRAFTSHTHESSFRELLREYSQWNCPRPSGYADVFHELFLSPRVSYSVNALLAPAMAGGWQAALKPGVIRSPHYRYDMRSAYLWAATLGLPDTSTYTRSLEPWKMKNDGVYRIKLIEPNPDAPFPFNSAHECLATNIEMELYNLRVGEIVDGVVWKGTDDGEPILKAIQSVSTWKQAARSYWGRWAQIEKVTCTAHGRKWTLPNLALNIPWAHLIVSRVRMRLWEFAKDAAHVFVDSIITPKRFPVGDGLGDWRLEKEYPLGVVIRGAGQYGALGEVKLERMAGVALDSLQRHKSMAVA